MHKNLLKKTDLAILKSDIDKLENDITDLANRDLRATGFYLRFSRF